MILTLFVVALATPAGASVPGNLRAYIDARTASASGDVEQAADRYAALLASAPDNPVVARRAFREGMKAGDMTLAAQAAAALKAAKPPLGDIALLELAQAVHADDLAAAAKAIDAIAGGPLAPLAPSLRAWLAFAKGQDPMPALNVADNNVIAGRFAAETRGQLLVATGHADEGVAVLATMIAGDSNSFDLRVSASELLASAGRHDDAMALLRGDEPLRASVRAHLGNGTRPSLGFGVSRLYTRVAGELASGKPSPLSVTLTRAALVAEPGNDRARLLLAQSLAQMNATRRALAVLDQVDARGAYADQARTARIGVYTYADDPAGALKAAGAVAERPDATAAEIQQYGDQLMTAGRYDAAADAYAKVIAGGKTDWSAWLQYGGALDQAGHWPQARAALQRAVALGPDEPLALNYLGYEQISHGVSVGDSRRMLEKAARLKPDDLSIADSLAYAYLKNGDATRALPMLEAAVRGQPVNAAIDEHLGDAYWAVGRRYEARYAWRAAKLVADAGDQARLTAKIEGGPGAAQHP